MNRKLTRRQVVAAAAVPAAMAQAPKIPPAPTDDLQAARDKVRQDGEKLTQFKIDLPVEPAFRFKA